ncbi:hypothetical protein CLORY_21410 [Clostridium oryzae]|uniref:Transporter n=1 Tax=Clostridium oryzae TaxID=1450648 RepID=A0A1V4INM5_9CLOT|nr:hypothetical protein CLORY_21410 [Clostridium oryzae]
MAMNLFGHGVALSGDFVIQGAPKLTADAAGIPVNNVVSASIPLVMIMGITTTVAAYYFLSKDMKNNKIQHNKSEIRGKYIHENTVEEVVKVPFSGRLRKAFAIAIPLVFVIDIVIMYFLKLQGGDATALIGGTALFILIIIAIFAYKRACLEKVTDNFIEGLMFGFKVFGPVIPIAAFFYLGDAGISDIIGKVLPVKSQGIVNDLGLALANAVPINSIVSAVTVTVVGAITGLDGSGFSGISLAGSTAKLFALALGKGTATLTALGQIAAIYVGGGTLVPWALIPAAAICGINPFELARRNFKPVMIGLAVTVVAAIIIL